MARPRSGYYNAIEYIGPRPQKPKKQNFFGGWVIVAIAVVAGIFFGKPLIGGALAAEKGPTDAQAEVNPHFPALRSGPTAVSGATRQKQIPSSQKQIPSSPPNPSSSATDASRSPKAANPPSTPPVSTRSPSPPISTPAPTTSTESPEPHRPSRPGPRPCESPQKPTHGVRWSRDAGARTP